MIDIHNHIIPRVDDGPSNEEEMLEMINQAANQGITGIVATPHHLHYKYNNEYKSIEKKVDEINNNKEVKKLGVKIYPGQEVRILDKLLEHIDTGKIRGINNSKYLLIEFPSSHIPKYTRNIFYEIQKRGYIPVIAHPERNKEIAQDINKLYSLVKAGALSQLTASSLTGFFGKKIQRVSMKMIEHNIVHFIASDAHSIEERPFNFDSLLNQKNMMKYHEEILSFLNNNKRMVENKKVSINIPVEVKRKSFFGLF